MNNLTEFEAPTPDESDAIFLVNVVHVFEGQQDAALDVLRSAVSYVAQAYPSFQWSRLFKSIDGKTVINQAQWSSKEDFDSLFCDEQFLSRYNRLKETGTWEFHLYKVNDYIPAAYAPVAAALV
ncbi:antibiotic biosynthesis monooxygenase family protein [Pseudomonas sp. 6D_7.1_Bac1]|uniref:antibiotic biosynthesis monooxygenase family protein n=1 Tax=Pseudomonas sp. 6D_7.1_Bac1 TaxID=2971615 RepID=UPI0021CA5E89|nr:antibiotic biosynthesis monooxygenase [Pseudomonas sp. 6D_7.1_Bac1]MCU1751223.1 antibiotic biosynthesis monooxygenase [Pseudomonas sp. 6D_7.1_Bac1]